MALRNFKSLLKDYLTFSTRERNAVFIMMAIIILLVAGMFYIRFYKDESPVDFSQFEADIAVFEKKLQAEENEIKLKKSAYAKKSYKIPAKEKPILFTFNPNNLNDSLWRKLGINERAIRTIKNFEAKGGRFYKKEDLKKIYNLNENDYNRLAAYIEIPKRAFFQNKDTAASEKEIKKEEHKADVIMDLNVVTSEDLETLEGIGQIKAKSIIQYRTQLGGYTGKTQLLEAYGIDSALYFSIEGKLKIQSRNIQMIHINKDHYMRHPYISKQLAQLIISRRKMHGSFDSIEEIKKIPLVNEELFRKLAPYITVEDE